MDKLVNVIILKPIGKLLVKMKEQKDYFYNLYFIRIDYWNLEQVIT